VATVVFNFLSNAIKYGVREIAVLDHAALLTPAVRFPRRRNDAALAATRA